MDIVLGGGCRPNQRQGNGFMPAWLAQTCTGCWQQGTCAPQEYPVKTSVETLVEMMAVVWFYNTWTKRGCCTSNSSSQDGDESISRSTLYFLFQVLPLFPLEYSVCWIYLSTNLDLGRDISTA